VKYPLPSRSRVPMFLGGLLLGALIVGSPVGAQDAGEPWAVVNADGSLARGSGVVRTVGEDGEYRVYFDQYVNECAFSATIGREGNEGSKTPGLITVEVADSSAGIGVYWEGGVEVRTYSLDGRPAAHSFHLLVAC
jgi:hypothetical protein